MSCWSPRWRGPVLGSKPSSATFRKIMRLLGSPFTRNPFQRNKYFIFSYRQESIHETENKSVYFFKYFPIFNVGPILSKSISWQHALLGTHFIRGPYLFPTWTPAASGIGGLAGLAGWLRGVSVRSLAGRSASFEYFGIVARPAFLARLLLEGCLDRDRTFSLDDLDLTVWAAPLGESDSLERNIWTFDENKETKSKLWQKLLMVKKIKFANKW